MDQSYSSRLLWNTDVIGCPADERGRTPLDITTREVMRAKVVDAQFDVSRREYARFISLVRGRNISRPAQDENIPTPTTTAPWWIAMGDRQGYACTVSAVDVGCGRHIDNHRSTPAVMTTAMRITMMRRMVFFAVMALSSVSLGALASALT